MNIHNPLPINALVSPDRQGWSAGLLFAAHELTQTGEFVHNVHGEKFMGKYFLSFCYWQQLQMAQFIS